MNLQFDHARNVRSGRDSNEVPRQLIHTHAPIRIEASSPKEAADEYVHGFGEDVNVRTVDANPQYYFSQCPQFLADNAYLGSNEFGEQNHLRSGNDQA